jgi:ABC-type amino acid transport substrate-binding protein
MKYIYSLFLFFFVAIQPLYSNASDKILAYVEQIPPYVFINDNSITGSIIDILNEALKEHDIDIHYQEINWSRALYESEHKANTLLTVVIRNPSREHKYHWLYKLSVHTKKQRFFLWRLKNTSTENKQRGLKNASVSVMRGAHKISSYEHYVEELGYQANIYPVGSREQVIHMLFKGRVDFIIGGELNNPWRVKSLGYDPDMIERVVELPNTSQGFYIAIGKHTELALVNKIRKALVDLEQSGRVSEIMSQWLKSTGKNASSESVQIEGVH